MMKDKNCLTVQQKYIMTITEFQSRNFSKSCFTSSESDSHSSIMTARLEPSTLDIVFLTFCFKITSKGINEFSTTSDYTCIFLIGLAFFFLPSFMSTSSSAPTPTRPRYTLPLLIILLYLTPTPESKACSFHI